jgi:hypothetical protein
LGALERYLNEKNSKNTKTQQQQIFSKKILVSMKNLSQYSRGPSLKLFKKKFKQAPQTALSKHTSYNCCSLVIFIDFEKKNAF